MKTTQKQTALAALVMLAAAAGCDAPKAAEQAPSTAPQASCEPFVPHDAEPLSLEAAREAHFWNGLHTRWRFDEHKSPGHLVKETAAVLERTRQNDGALCYGDAYIAGRLIFEHTFSPADGQGNGAATEGNPIKRVHDGQFGAPEARRCRSCHWRGGVAGAGAVVDNAYLLGDGDSIESSDAHNPPSLHGVGVLQALAVEMTAELQGLKTKALAKAGQTGKPQRVRLESKGVDFGVLAIKPDGAVDAADLKGIDADLVVRPFGWKGNHTNLRNIVQDSFQIHLGIQPQGLVKGGDRALLGDGPGDDPDKDGVKDELTDAQVTATVLFLAAQGMPVMRPHERLNEAEASAEGLMPPTSAVFLDEWMKGRRLFDKVGCAGCHTPSMILKESTFTTTDAKGTVHTLDLSTSMERPRLVMDKEAGGYPVYLFSDLKRHDMGPALGSRHSHDGVAPNMFQTPPLWGLADSGPWMHDGRAPSIDLAIRAHGGEGEASKRAYAAWTAPEAMASPSPL